LVINWLKQLDELLRGERVRGELLLQGKIDLKLRVFVPLAIVLGGAYGFFMGFYALLAWRHGSIMQLVATTVKLPALFLLTLGVTFPSLYVFNALVGCRMTFQATMRVLVGAIVVNLAIAASLGPILAFFSLSTTSYVFIVLLNVALLSVAGVISLSFLLRALRALARSRAHAEAASEAEQAMAQHTLHQQSHQPLAFGEGGPPPIPGPPMNAPPIAPGFSRLGEQEDPARAADRMRHAIATAAARRAEQVVAKRESVANFILTIWVVIYMLVGTQMGWILRPFIGNPGAEFAWFRPREGSFFTAVWGAIQHFFGM
jgi:hypothetical protein